MTFENQVKRAKEEKLKYRIYKDLVFIILGVVFLAVSIIIGISNSGDAKEKQVNNYNTIKEN